jgi:hypothetical protein
MKVAARVVLLCCVALGNGSAQNVGASLQGTVHDQSNAVIPGAQVVIRNMETGSTHNLTASESGRWREPILPPGDYELRVSAGGFQTVVRKGIHLDVGQDAVIDLLLEVGAAGTEISVIAEAPSVNLVSGAVSGLVDQK